MADSIWKGKCPILLKNNKGNLRPLETKVKKVNSNQNLSTRNRFQILETNETQDNASKNQPNSNSNNELRETLRKKCNVNSMKKEPSPSPIFVQGVNDYTAMIARSRNILTKKIFIRNP